MVILVQHMGEGSYGAVYRVQLDGSKVFAVKAVDCKAEA